jgi:hypothetical protein
LTRKLSVFRQPRRSSGRSGTFGEGRLRVRFCWRGLRNTGWLMQVNAGRKPQQRHHDAHVFQDLWSWRICALAICQPRDYAQMHSRAVQLRPHWPQPSRHARRDHTESAAQTMPNNATGCGRITGGLPSDTSTGRVLVRFASEIEAIACNDYPMKTRDSVLPVGVRPYCLRITVEASCRRVVQPSGTKGAKGCDQTVMYKPRGTYRPLA